MSVCCFCRGANSVVLATEVLRSCAAVVVAVVCVDIVAFMIGMKGFADGESDLVLLFSIAEYGVGISADAAVVVRFEFV